MSRAQTRADLAAAHALIARAVAAATLTEGERILAARKLADIKEQIGRLDVLLDPEHPARRYALQDQPAGRPVVHRVGPDGKPGERTKEAA